MTNRNYIGLNYHRWKVFDYVTEHGFARGWDANTISTVGQIAMEEYDRLIGDSGHLKAPSRKEYLIDTQDAAAKKRVIEWLPEKIDFWFTKPVE
jgi:hypothetical protein